MSEPGGAHEAATSPADSRSERVRGRHEAGHGARSGPRWLPLVLALAVLADLGTSAGVIAHRRREPVVAARPHTLGVVARDATREKREAQRTAAVRALLDRRAKAVLAHDATAFVATVDGSQLGFRRRQQELIRNLAQVPFESFSYALDADRSDPAEPSELKRYRAETWVPQVRLLYRLKGFDKSPTVLEQKLTFVHRSSGWVIGADDDFASAGSKTDRDLWDRGPVVVHRTARVLVLGHPSSAGVLPGLAQECEHYIDAVTRVWGTDWAQRVVVLVPETQEELGSIIAEGNDLSQIAAVATASVTLVDGKPQPVGDRVVVNPRNFRRLGPLGRKVVLTHEITHVASRAHSESAPTWLVEGMADYVGYREAGVGVRSAATELAADVRKGKLPTALPDEQAFDGLNPELAQVYEMSWLACRLIASRKGDKGLVRFYRHVGDARKAPDQALADALRTDLATTTRAFVADWRQSLRAQLS